LAKILTPHEINLVEKRLAVLNLLKKKLSYRQISEIADVHKGTISFIKKGFVRVKKSKGDNKKKFYKNSPERKLRPSFRRYRYLRKIS